MTVWRWIGALAVAVLAASMLGAAPAAARWQQWSDQLDPAIGPASNLNSLFVAGVAPSGSAVLVRDVSVGRWTDVGAPGRVRRLAVSATWVYAVVDGNLLYEYDRQTGAWRRLRDGVVDVLASRDGAWETVPNGPPRFRPNLFVVSDSGEILHRVAGDWTAIGSGAAGGTLAEYGGIGSSVLFLLAADHRSILRWDAGAWSVAGGPATSIAANFVSLVATDPGGKLQVYDPVTRHWSTMVDAAGEPAPPRRAGSRVWLGLRSLYYQPSGGHELWGAHRPPFAPGPAVKLSWHLISTGPIAALATHEEVGSGSDLVSVNKDGAPGQFAWGRLDLAERFGTLVALRYAPYRAVIRPVRWWHDRLMIDSVIGGVPLGLVFSIENGGELVLSGVPEIASTYTPAVRLVDSAGLSIEIEARIVVEPAATSMPSPPVPTESWREITVANCLRSGAYTPIWLRDRTAGTDWARVGDPLPPSAVVDVHGENLCTPSPTRTIPLPAGHLVELAVLNPPLPQCGDTDDPRVDGCRQAHLMLFGGSAPFPEVYGVRDW